MEAISKLNKMNELWLEVTSNAASYLNIYSPLTPASGTSDRPDKHCLPAGESKSRGGAYRKINEMHRLATWTSKYFSKCDGAQHVSANILHGHAGRQHIHLDTLWIRAMRQH